MKGIVETSEIRPVNLQKSTLLVMSFAAGAAVANIYFNQPLLEQMRQSFAVSYEKVGLIPTLTQAGYAAGMFLLVPLGDMLARKRLVLFFSILSVVACALVSIAPSFGILAAASLLLGVSTMTPQLLVPFAASLADPKEKGRVVGTMVSGLLLGILLARTVSGFVGAAYGWRAMFMLAAGFQGLMFLILFFALPKSVPSYHGRYVGLLKSVVDLFKTQPILRETCLFGGVLFGAFSMFWATLIHLMETPTFNLGARAVGLYGLLGAGAAALSPVVGGIIDKRSPRHATGIMMMVVIVSFVIFGLSAASLIGIGAGVLIMDIGVQSGHVANQGRVLALVPGAQSRLQTAYMFFYFTGGAIGSFVGGWAWAHYQWLGVCTAAIIMVSLGVIQYARPAPRTSLS